MKSKRLKVDFRAWAASEFFLWGKASTYSSLILVSLPPRKVQSLLLSVPEGQRRQCKFIYLFGGTIEGWRARIPRGGSDGSPSPVWGLGLCPWKMFEIFHANLNIQVLLTPFLRLIRYTLAFGMDASPQGRPRVQEFWANVKGWFECEETNDRFTRMCLLRLEDWLKLFAQTTHLWGLCFSCTCRMWIRSRSRFSKDLHIPRHRFTHRDDTSFQRSYVTSQLIVPGNQPIIHSG